MGWTDWLDLIRTACVVGAFLGLIIQIRLAAKAMRAGAYQGVVSQVEGLHERLSMSEEAATFKAAIAPNAEATPQQILLALSLLNLLENAHFQYRSGIIPKRLWRGWQEQMNVYFRIPFFQEVWQANSTSYNERFRILMEKAKRSSPSDAVDEQ